MAQGTPRKFSEKIAIMERKQNEDQEAFCSVLREVRAITNSATSQSPAPSLAPPVPWNRSGGSLPNVHQMSQMAPGYPQGAWTQHGGFWPAAQGAHPSRGRSPGPHYHPYGHKQHKYSSERVPSLDYSMPCPPVHLQPPDSHWPNFRTISDPAIHANVYQQQPQQQQQQQMGNSGDPYYPDSPASSSQMYPTAMNNHHPQDYFDSTPVGSLPNMNSPVFSPNFQMYNHHQQVSQRNSTGASTGYQQLATPPSLMELSQSAPTSPSSLSHPSCTGAPSFTSRNMSTSPDPRDIPNIILTGTDGELDVFQDLNINETELKQLLLDPAGQAVDPACENALLN